MNVQLVSQRGTYGNSYGTNGLKHSTTSRKPPGYGVSDQCHAKPHARPRILQHAPPDQEVPQGGRQHRPAQVTAEGNYPKAPSCNVRASQGERSGHPARREPSKVELVQKCRVMHHGKLFWDQWLDTTYCVLVSTAAVWLELNLQASASAMNSFCDNISIPTG